MKNYLAFILVLLCFNALAQQDTTTVYGNPGYNKDPLRSRWIPKVDKQDSLWVLSLYNKKKVLQEKISYADAKLQVRKGPYAFYENGILRQEGFYEKGYKYGPWKNYSTLGKLEELLYYVWDVLNGAYALYWDNGQLKAKGQYLNGKKEGVWQMFDKGGNPINSQD